ncbi:MAG: MFS transporter [Acetobacteraceae bacterium]
MPNELETRVMRKVAWRIVPFIMILYLVSFLDRVNIGFAALTMNKAVGLTQAMFGLGAGIFFLGYFLFEVPSNLLLHRFGARVWIARVMITWGLVSGAMAFVTGPNSFYVLRFLLGAAEAGFFPASSSTSHTGSPPAAAPPSRRCSWPPHRSRPPWARRSPAG